MGGEIARLKNENRRTKTSIERMKSFHNQRKFKSKRCNFDPENFGERRRVNNSHKSKTESDRRHLGEGVSGSSEYNSSESSNAEFQRRRQSLRAKQIAARHRKTTNTNNKDRIATANSTSRRNKLQGLNNRAANHDKDNSNDSKLDILYEHLKQC